MGTKVTSFLFEGLLLKKYESKNEDIHLVNNLHRYLLFSEYVILSHYQKFYDSSFKKKTTFYTSPEIDHFLNTKIIQIDSCPLPKKKNHSIHV